MASQLTTIHAKVPNKRIACRVLSTVLISQYPSGPDAVNFSELCMWPLWPVYLKIHGSFTYKNLELPLSIWAPPVSDEENLYSVCSRALVLLEEVYNEIVTGSLTIKQLQCMEDCKGQLCKLCVASSASAVKRPQQLSTREIEASIKKHKDGYNEVMRRVGHLHSLLLNVSHLEIDGMPLLSIYHTPVYHVVNMQK